MIQSACDPGAPQKLTRHVIRGRVCIVCGTAPAALAARGVMLAKAVKPAIPDSPSMSRRVKRGFDSIMSSIGAFKRRRWMVKRPWRGSTLARQPIDHGLRFGGTPTPRGAVLAHTGEAAKGRRDTFQHLLGDMS